MTRFKIRQRVKTRVESSRLNWRNPVTSGLDVAGNSSDILYKLGQALDIGISTGGCLFSGNNFGNNVANTVEDYACADYKCLTLDCIATTCDSCAFACSAFLPKNSITGCLYAGFSGASQASKTIRNRCKQAGGFCK